MTVEPGAQGTPGLHERGARSKLSGLHRLLGSMPSAVVAFSGGADSTLLAFMAHQALGDAALAVTADSPSLPRAELREAIDLARRLGLRHMVVGTSEMSDRRYTRNDSERCAFCKTSLLDALDAVVQATGAVEVLLGVNADDLGDHRPGQQAAASRGARFPLVEVSLTKPEVRWLSRELGLPTWNKPAAACLASRIAYGVPVTVEALRRIEESEEVLRLAGFRGSLRVRDQGRDLARIEVDPGELDLLLVIRAEVVKGLKRAGFLFVTVDLEGYRQGSHNLSLPLVRPGLREPR